MKALATHSLVIGVDPGASGAVALFRPATGGLTIHDMPTLHVERGGRAKREVSASHLAQILRGEEALSLIAYVEQVGARPGQGVSSMFQFGRSVGIVEGVLAGFAIPVERVTPQRWRRLLHVREGKDGSRLRAAELMPRHAALFARKADDGRAEAALLAYGGAAQLFS